MWVSLFTKDGLGCTSPLQFSEIWFWADANILLQGGLWSYHLSKESLDLNIYVTA